MASMTQTQPQRVASLEEREPGHRVGVTKESTHATETNMSTSALSRTALGFGTPAFDPALSVAELCDELKPNT